MVLLPLSLPTYDVRKNLGFLDTTLSHLRCYRLLLSQTPSPVSAGVIYERPAPYVLLQLASRARENEQAEEERVMGGSLGVRGESAICSSLSDSQTCFCTSA